MTDEEAELMGHDAAEDMALGDHIDARDAELRALRARVAELEAKNGRLRRELSRERTGGFGSHSNEELLEIERAALKGRTDD
jgi:hypothetical protein